MSEQQSSYLFHVSNHQVPDAGEPPVINGDESGHYHSYFENASREQLVFVYDYESQQGQLWHGDAGWHRAYPVRDGKAPGLVLDDAEQLWLKACWTAARPRQVK